MERLAKNAAMETSNNPGDDQARLIIPVLALLVTGVAVAVIVLFLAARSLDKRAIGTTTQLALSAMAAEQRALNNLAFDYTWWDEMTAHLVDSYDPTWADDNIGSYLSDTYGIGYSFMIGRDDKTLAAFMDGAPMKDADAFEVFPTGLRALVERTRTAPMDRPKPAVGLAMHRGGIQILVASAVTAENPTAEQLRRHVRPVFVMAKAVDDLLLAKMAGDFLLNGLHVDTAPAPQDSSSIILSDHAGTPIAHLIWRPDTPGRDLFRGLLPALVATFVVMGFLTVLFLRRTQEAWREKAALETHLALEVDARRHDAEHAHLQRFNTVGEMTTTFAHEINQPLSVISSYA